MSTSAVGLIKILQTQQLRIFSSPDMLTLSGMKSSALAQSLLRLEKQNLLKKVKRGIWVNQLVGDFSLYEIIPYLTAPWPSYISLYSALSEEGIIEEVPSVIYAVSSALPRRYLTALGEFHIHHLPERLMWGFTTKQIGRGFYPIAEPEKAFLDTVYLALIPRSKIELPYKRENKWNLNLKKLRQYALKFNYPPLVNYLKENKII